MASSRFFFQLNDGEQLYESILFGNSRSTPSANSFASAKSGFDVSHQMQIGVRRVGDAASDCRWQAAANLEESFVRALAGAEFLVARVNVARDQSCAVRVGARHHQRGHAHHVRREPRRDEFLNRFRRRHQHFAAEMAALFRGRQLILEMNARRARLDHALHQLERVQIAAESGFGVRHHGREPVRVVFSFGVMRSDRRAAAPD